MKSDLTILVSAAFVVTTTGAIAQTFDRNTSVNGAIDTWSRENGVTVTDEVRGAVGRNEAIEFLNGAPKVGLKPRDAWRLGGVIASGGTVQSTTRGNFWVMMGRTDTGQFVTSARPSPPQQIELFDEASKAWLNFTELGSHIKAHVFQLLQTYPKVHLVVQPVPPKDYTVKINGKLYGTMDEYLVPTGTLITFKVERAGKMPCDWSGQVVEDNMQIVCTL
jgi:hypothetical protein